MSLGLGKLQSKEWKFLSELEEVTRIAEITPELLQSDGRDAEFRPYDVSLEASMRAGRSHPMQALIEEYVQYS